MQPKVEQVLIESHPWQREEARHQGRDLGFQWRRRFRVAVDRDDGFRRTGRPDAFPQLLEQQCKRQRGDGDLRHGHPGKDAIQGGDAFLRANALANGEAEQWIGRWRFPRSLAGRGRLHAEARGIAHGEEAQLQDLDQHAPCRIAEGRVEYRDVTLGRQVLAVPYAAHHRARQVTVDTNRPHRQRNQELRGAVEPWHQRLRTGHPDIHERRVHRPEVEIAAE